MTTAPHFSLPYKRLQSSHERLWGRIPLYYFPKTTSSSAIRLFSNCAAPQIKVPPQRPASLQPPSLKLTHLSSTGTAHMVSITSKDPTSRTAIAVCSVHFSNPVPLRLIAENGNKKGDVLSVARIAGIMAAKRTPDLVPLCHPVMVSFVGVAVEVAGIDEMERNNAAVTGTENEGGTEKNQISLPWAGTGQGDKYVQDWKPHVSAVAPMASQSLETGEMEDAGNGNGRIDITATVSCEGKTGVEMEALTAASVAALTVYDMCKAVDKRMRIEGLRVVRKEGGKSGTWVEGESKSGE